MLAINGAVIGLGYILGLLLTGISGQVGGVPVGAIALLVLGVVSAWVMPRCWRSGPRLKIWLIAGLMGFLAVFYYQGKVPHPAPTDISHWVTAASEVGSGASNSSFQIQGQIKTSPRLTQSQRIQFELEATQAQIEANTEASTPGTTTQSTGDTVTGRVYVTVPLLQGTGLYPGQKVILKGSLYKPEPAVNPGGFDFAQYLANQGIFTGLNGKQVDVADRQSAPPLLWSIRQRIIRAQVQGLGVPEGPIVSAMVMGGRSVDVPHDLRDQFRRAGLAHALAASGAQVSLLIGVVLALTQQLSPQLRLMIGSSVLASYLCLTGLEASVLRAGVMGFIALIALSSERKVKPLASILFAATLLLLFNPLWVWDLGFQLSFLATLGLLVTVPVLTRWLDWMPSALTPLFTVPIAAYLWTLPLILFVFGVVSPCSILVNVLTSPFITIISIGGMISALAALVYPLAGSGLAWLLYYPTHLFIQIAAWGSQLPGSSWAVGSITIAQLILLYGLIGLIWLWRKSQRYWWSAALISLGLVALPAWYGASHLLQATVLTTTGQPVLVWQDRGRVALLNSGSEVDAKFTVLPFLQKQGINQIDWAIAPTLRATDLEGWQRILAHIPIRAFYSDMNLGIAVADRSGSATRDQLWREQLQVRQGKALGLTTDRALQLGSATIRFLSQNPPVLSLHFAEQTWLLLPDRLSLAQQSALAQYLPNAEVLWWTGGTLSPALLAAIRPEVAIVSERSIDSQTQDWLQSHQVAVFVGDRDGAVQWTPKHGFKAMREAS